MIDNCLTCNKSFDNMISMDMNKSYTCYKCCNINYYFSVKKIYIGFTHDEYFYEIFIYHHTMHPSTFDILLDSDLIAKGNIDKLDINRMTPNKINSFIEDYKTFQ